MGVSTRMTAVEPHPGYVGEHRLSSAEPGQASSAFSLDQGMKCLAHESGLSVVPVKALRWASKSSSTTAVVRIGHLHSGHRASHPMMH